MQVVINLAAANIEPFAGLKGIGTHELCDTSAVLYQLSYQANLGARHFVSS